MGVKSFTDFPISSNNYYYAYITNGIYAIRFIFNRETALPIN